MTDELASIRRMRDQAKNELGKEYYQALTDKCRDGIEALIGDARLARSFVQWSMQFGDIYPGSSSLKLRNPAHLPTHLEDACLHGHRIVLSGSNRSMAG